MLIIINNNIYNKKKINKRKIYSKYAKHLQDAQNSAERQKVIEDCARNLLYFVAQNDDPYNAVINQRCRHLRPLGAQGRHPRHHDGQLRPWLRGE